MGKTVILSVRDGDWNRWGDNFVKAQPPHSREQVLISTQPSVDEAKRILIGAIRQAGSGGTLIISVGHGSSVAGSAVDGMVDLAPGQVMRLGGLNADPSTHFLSVFYDVNVAGPPRTSDLDFDTKNNPRSTRLAHWRIYQEICKAFTDTGLREVVLLSCNVGNAVDFIRKIASDWKVIVRAFKVQVGIDPNGPRPKVYLANHPPPYPTAAETILHEEYLPYSPSDTLLVGPPLPPP